MLQSYNKYSLEILSLLQCLKSAEEKGKIPKLPEEWWADVEGYKQIDNRIDSEEYFKQIFSARAFNALTKRNKIFTLRPLLNMSEDDIKMLIGVGRKTADEIIGVVNSVVEVK